jgi:hypothetical protein
MSGLHLIARMIANPLLPAVARLIDLIERCAREEDQLAGQHDRPTRPEASIPNARISRDQCVWVDQRVAAFARTDVDRRFGPSTETVLAAV